MTETTPLRPTVPGSRVPRTARILLLGTLAGLSLAACNSSKSPKVVTNNPGAVLTNPATNMPFVVDESFGGQAAELHLSRLGWGRLVDVYGLDNNNERVLRHRNFVIDPFLVSNGSTYDLDTATLTGRDELTILRNLETPDGMQEFNQLLVGLGNGINPIFDAGSAGVGFFSMVPRNAAIQMVFDDLLDPSTIDTTTVRLLTGTPQIVPFEGRLLPDANYGDLVDTNGDGVGEFFTTRLVIDMTISQFESFETSPPALPNNLGLPASVDTNQSNVQLRIPTATDSNFGQERVLANRTGHAISLAGNGTVDFSSSTAPVVRNMRSGGTTAITGDSFNGFLRDDTPPRVVGLQEGSITALPVPLPGGSPTEYLIPGVQFLSFDCAQQMHPGDVISQSGVVMQVLADTVAPIQGLVPNVAVNLLVWPLAWGDVPDEWPSTAVDSVQFLSAWDAVEDQGTAQCFVQVFPNALGFPSAPTTNLFTNSSIGVRFNEAMAADSMQSFETIRLTRKDLADANFSSADWILGEIQSSISLQEFSFVPNLPMAHEEGTSETYFFDLAGGNDGPTDLAGNALAADLPSVICTIWPGDVTQENGSRLSPFDSADEDLTISTPDDPFIFNEWGGEHVYLPQLGAIRPRPVTRFRGVVSREVAEDGGGISGEEIVGIMLANPTGVQDPLSSFGSRTQYLWRYVDVGFDIYDPTTIDLTDPTVSWRADRTSYNLDIEGLSWSPFGGGVVVDHYDVFEMRLSHTPFLPDEIINQMTQLPIFPNSGLSQGFDLNLLSPTEDPQRIVHERSLGYTVNPGDVYLVGQNTRLIPWPMNRTIPPSQHRYYTWRDTTLQTRGGPNTSGVNPLQWDLVINRTSPITDGVADANCDILNAFGHPFYNPGQIQSVALPLLMEFRCFPDDGAVGVNRFDVSLAVTASTQPFFRAFSTGGIDNQLQQILVDPDLQTQANGGFNPNSIPVPGSPTFGRDDSVYIGAMDFVVRTSRSYSIWWEVVDKDGQVFPNSAITNPSFQEPVIEPRPELQPAGTSVTFAFRGADSVDAPLGGNLVFDYPFHCRQAASQLDAYGDHYVDNTSDCDGSTDHNIFAPDGVTLQINTPVGFHNSDSTWFDDVTAINGSLFYQVRITFVSNATTTLSPILSAFGMSWVQGS